MCNANGFSPRTATKEQIEERARWLPKLLGGIQILDPNNPRRPNLGDAGFAIENHFGIEGNSFARPDFWKAGIELKTVSLIRGARGFRSKEKTYITAINYDDIVHEKWGPSLGVLEKLNTLLVFVEDLPSQDWRTFPVIGHAFCDFMKDESFARLAEADWLRLRAKIRACGAHELSARDGWVLAPATKAANSRSTRPQHCGPKAKPRSFALRQSLMKAVYRQELGSHTKALERLLTPRADPDLEKLIEARLGQFMGQSVGQVAEQLEYRATGSSRSYGADVVQLALGAKKPRSRIAEFDEAGVTLRRPRVNRLTGVPYEDLSFPAFWAKDLRNESSWEESALKALIETMLFVPLYGQRRNSPIRGCTIGRPVFWRPDDAELRNLGKEWAALRGRLLDGDLKNLREEHIHMRPHARTAKDKDSVRGRSFTRKSYWLNRDVVARILS